MFLTHVDPLPENHASLFLLAHPLMAFPSQSVTRILVFFVNPRKYLLDDQSDPQTDQYTEIYTFSCLPDVSISWYAEFTISVRV